jgi:hypothetical protein
MALVSPLRKDMEKANREIDALNRVYNVYFMGGEEDPPRNQRKTLDATIEKIKAALTTANNAADKFQANTLISRYRTMCARWDKHLRGIENGTIVRPKNRE